MKPWQKGFELELLKSIAAPFKQDFAPHTYGAFGLPKERDVANALADKDIIYKKDASSAAIFKVLKASSIQQDWAGRSIRPHRGDLLIKHICGDSSPASQTEIITTLMQRAGNVPTFVEIHEEREQAKALLESLGFQWVLTKISASSDLKGVYFKGSEEQRQQRVFAPKNHTEEVAMSKVKEAFISKADREQIYKEAQGFAKWAQHYSSYNKRQSWTAFAIQGYDPKDPMFIQKPAEMSKQWKAENPERLRAGCQKTCDPSLFKKTWEIVDRIPGKKQRVRFMRLAKESGELTRHADITDREAGVQDQYVSRLHIPITSPIECRFHAWTPRGKHVDWHWDEDQLYYLDMRKPHAVKNPGDKDRIHLVVDTYSSAELRRWIDESVVAA